MLTTVTTQLHHERRVRYGSKLRLWTLAAILSIMAYLELQYHLQQSSQPADASDAQSP